MTSAVIHRVTTLDLKFRPGPWPFADERRGEIAAHFALKQREKPLWNGRVLLGRDPVFSGSHFAADYFETDFSNFLAWRDWGFPDREVFNGFGMGALRSRDGAFAMGEMSQRTANAGRIYFPSGTPDRNDLRGDMVDMAASVAREVEEETGLTPSDYTPALRWDCVVTGASIAMMRVLQINLDGEALRGRIEANLARQQEPELSAIHLIRTKSDLTAAMPLFITAFVEAQFRTSS
jgi:8-oxo-dGTP pyrophosphatase MutT (NUDIX family)